MSGEELRALAEAARPGPWKHVEHRSDGGRIREHYVTAGDLYITQEIRDVNAAFIAAANPTAVLALLDEVDALRAQVERVAAVLAAPGWHPRHAAHEGCHICMFHGQLRAALDGP